MARSIMIIMPSARESEPIEPEADATEPAASRVVSSLDVVEMPWTFSQSHPLSTGQFRDEAKKRGLDLSVPMLRELYRHGDLTPLVEITSRSVREPVALSDPPGLMSSSLRFELRHALGQGRVRDLATEMYRPRLRFDERRRTDPRNWINGLIYSRWQLLAIPDLRERIAQGKQSGPYERRRFSLPASWHGQLDFA